MAETHELRLKINAAAAKSGAREFTGALKSIKLAVRDLERDASGAFLKLQKGIKNVTGNNGKLKIGVDKQAIRDMDTMSKKQAAYAKSLATSAINARNLNKVVGLLSRSYGRATTNGDAFLKSLRSQNSTILRQIQLVGQLRSQLGSLKGSSAKVNVSTGQGKNTSAAQTAAAHAAGSAAARAGSHQTGRGGAAWMVEREMRSIAGAANAKDAAIRRATGGMRGLENAFSSTYQIGSAFRVMLGAITFGSFISSVYQAGDALSQFRVSMEIATGSAAGAMGELDYADEVAMRLGVNLQSVRDNYSKFAIASDIAGVSMDKTRHIFEAVSTSMAVLGKSTADQNLAFLALEQMMSKGKVSSEELRRQLGERLPGAVSMMAEALGVGVDQLQDMLKAGEINSADALPKFADVLMKRFAPGVEKASRRASNNLQKLQTQITKFFEAVAESGVMDELAYQFRILTDALKDGAADSAARKFGEAFTKMVSVAGDAMVWLVDNFDKIGASIKAIAIAGLVARVGHMATAFTTAGVQMFGYTAAIANGVVQKRLAAVQTTSLTAATVGNTKATVANAYAQATMNTGIGRVAKSAAAMRGAMALATRGLALLGPAAAVVSGALLLWPTLFGKAEQSATQFGTSVDAAVSRSGVKFEELSATVQDTVSAITFDRILTDLSLLDRGLEDFLNKNSTRRTGLMQASLLATGSDTRARIRPNKDIKSAGIDPSDTEGLTDAAQGDLLGIIDAYTALENGQGNVLALQVQIQRAMRQSPSGIPLFQAWAGFLKDLERVELAANANQDALARVYGTSAEKQMLAFAESAKKVMQRKMDISDLMDIRNSTSGNGAVPKFMDQALRALKNHMKNGSPETFMEQMREAWISSTTLRMEGLEHTLKTSAEQIKRERENFDSVGQQLSDTLSTDMTSMTTGTNPTFSNRLDGELNAAIGSFDIWRDKIKTVDGMTEALNRLQQSTKNSGQIGLETYVHLLINKFNQLPTASRNVAGLRSAMDALEASARKSGGTYTAFRTAVEETLTPAKQLENALKDLKLPAQYDQMIADLVASAQAMESNEKAAAQAQKDLNDGADSIASIGVAANSAKQALEGLASAISTLQGLAGTIPATAAEVADEISFQASQKALPVWERKANEFLRKQTKTAKDVLQAGRDAGLGGIDLIALQLEHDKAVKIAKEGAEQIRKESLKAYNTEEWTDPKKKKGGGSSRNKSDSQKYSDLMSQVVTNLDDLEIASDAYQYLVDGMFETSEAAELMAKAMAYGGGAVDATTEALIRQIDAAGLANEELEKLANDPIKDWLKSANSWVEGSQKIKMDGVESLSDAIHEFIMTGKFDFQQFTSSILSSMARVLADKITAQFVELLGGGGSGSDGGFIGTAVSSIFGLFGAGSEGGYAGALPGRQAMPISAFRNAPHYAEGTANTSNGIPAVLHPNEAVVPLSRGRKIPVDIGDSAKGGNSINVVNNITVEGGSDNDAELAAQIAKSVEESLNGIVDTRMAEGMQYGGIMNPRGGM